MGGGGEGLNKKTVCFKVYWLIVVGIHQMIVLLRIKVARG